MSRDDEQHLNQILREDRDRQPHHSTALLLLVGIGCSWLAIALSVALVIRLVEVTRG